MKKGKSSIRSYRRRSLGFGLLMGLLFPLYAQFFVDFKSPLMFALFLLGCLAAGLGVGTFSYLIGKRTLIAPLQKVSRFVDEHLLRQQDFTQEIQLQSDDEIGALILSVNTVVKQCRIILSDLKDLADKNKQSLTEFLSRFETAKEHGKVFQEDAARVSSETKKLQNQIEQSVVFVRDLKNFTDQVYTGLDEQQNSIWVGTTGLEKLFGFLNGFLERSQTRIDELKEFFQKAENFQTSMSSAGQQIQLAADSTESIALHVSEIKKISARTNMLSINSSIEAAHAGSFGYGFAVVSDEIRQLAESTARAAKMITDMLEGISSEVELANQAVEEAGVVTKGLMSGLSRFRDYFQELSAYQQLVKNEETSQLSQWGDLSKHITAMNQGSRDFLQKFLITDSILQEISEISIEARGSTETMEKNINAVGKSFDEVQNLTTEQIEDFMNLQAVLERFKT